MWPEKRTAILVIHGVGQQDSFETLDRLVRGFKVTLEQLNKPVVIELSHRLHRKKDKDETWTESCISLSRKGDAVPTIDCYEYYWAHETQRKIEMDEVVEWALDTGSAAYRFYDENEELAKKYESLGVDAFSKGKFQKRWYLKQLGFSFWLIRWLLPLAGVVMDALPDKLKNVVRIPLLLFGRIAKTFLVDYAGDVAIYTSSNKKSEFYETRKKILDGAVEKVTWLLTSDELDYDQIILMGHSLGSVVAYDTLNRINNQMNINPQLAEHKDKLRGLVTFGSPLDKTAFFFRERAKQDQYVRRQMLDHYHGFKTKNFNLGKADAPNVRNDIRHLLDESVTWLNFWDPKDPIAGYLDFYEVDTNYQMHFDFGKSRIPSPFALGETRIRAHDEYWNPRDPDKVQPPERIYMYEKIISELLQPKPGSVPANLQA